MVRFFLLYMFFFLAFHLFTLSVCEMSSENIIFNIVGNKLGMGLSKGKIHGKMEFWEPTVLFLQTQTILTSFKPKIRLELILIFHRLKCIKLLEGLEDSMFIVDLLSRSLIRILMEILLYSLVIGTNPATRC